jgi:hypothetical protein
MIRDDAPPDDVRFQYKPGTLCNLCHREVDNDEWTRAHLRYIGLRGEGELVVHHRACHSNYLEGIDAFNYKQLLQKYIKHVIERESVDYLDELDCNMASERMEDDPDRPKPFTREEWIELMKLSKEVKECGSGS